MEEGDTKSCLNCKREIPASNFTIHSVHCARNIRVCPVCKEPVPAADLSTHHTQLHKLVPCKQCGEGVCGSDLEDHLRDSCALTPGACRYCELELPRRELPPHEAYCGARTQRCTCGELVMIKYQQLHEQSNHGFIKLEDEPGPEPSWAKNERARAARAPAASRAGRSHSPQQASTSTSNPGPNRTNGTVIRPILTSAVVFELPDDTNGSIGEGNLNLRMNPVKRTNDKPQINTSIQETTKVKKNLPSGSRGGVKKRPAPAPPREPPAADPMRDAAYYSALSRQQSEERARREQSEYNASLGLPPVLSAAAKLEKLRKLDALEHAEWDSGEDGAGRRGRPRASDPPEQPAPCGGVVGRSRVAVGAGDASHQAGTNNRGMSLQPMSPDEFMERFTRMQMSDGGSEPAAAAVEAGAAGDDRFRDIKRELRELRRGLNEVTAPYNSGNAAAPANAARRPAERRPAERRTALAPAAPAAAPPAAPAAAPPAAPTPPLDYLHYYHEMARDADGNDVTLPCEFCGQLVAPDDLVLHETGCRPDLARYNAATPPPRAAVASPRRPAAAVTPDNGNDDPAEPLIPCEFCLHAYPATLLMEHQEQCMG